MLFVLGGLVRSTGSGMGCPDWPKCFGEYIPPTSESELPIDYQEFFQKQRLKKTERFIGLLNKLGFTEKANEFSQNSQLSEKHNFNVAKAYVEYVNRLWGALTGIIVFLCFLFSLKYWKEKRKVFWYTLFGFIAVFINAFLGALVVNSNLIGGIVTIHFIAAFASICFFILARKYANDSSTDTLNREQSTIALLLMVFSAIQVVVGSSLREAYDLLFASNAFGQKLTELYPSLQWHAVLGTIVLVIAIYQFIKSTKGNHLAKYSKWVMLISFAQIIIGPLALIDSFSSISKLFHISFGAGIFVLQFYICTSIKSKNKKS